MPGWDADGSSSIGLQADMVGSMERRVIGWLRGLIGGQRERSSRAEVWDTSRTRAVDRLNDRPGEPDAPPWQGSTAGLYDSGFVEEVKRSEDVARAGQKAWVAAGQTVTVQGRELPGGMFYVGSDLPAISPYVSIEPALIDPKLPGNHRSPDRSGREMGYWPSYSEITPAARSAYLDWLAAGRPSGAYIGYVFLFFYGLERRVVFDAAHIDEARAEIPALLDEVERLLKLYQDNHSFCGYAGNLLSFGPLLHGPVDVGSLTPPLTRQGWEFPVELKLALGAIVNAGEPLPASWALSWLRTHPDIQLRTPANRCSDEFNELFRIRYQAEYRDGMKIRRNKTPLKLSYHPASGSLRSVIEFDAGDLPDVCRLQAPVRRLRELAQVVTDELDAYSRWVGRRGERDSFGAVALLPRELAESRQPTDLRRLLERIESTLGSDDTATILVPDLIEEYPSRRPHILTAREAMAFAELLEQRGFGVAPDIRCSEINLSKHQHAVVFRLPDGPPAPTDEYLGATVVLQLGAAVSAADGTVTEDEERQLETHLERALQLSTVDRNRLRAHLQWLLTEPPKLTGMRARLRALAPSQQDLVGRFCVSVAAADGHISPDEVKVLSRVYSLIGLDPDRLHSDLHALASGPATRPVTVLPPDEPTGRRIPPPTEAATASTDDGLRLDEQRISEVMAATREVTQLLTEIFEGPVEQEAEESDPGAAAFDDEEVETASDSALGGLDPAHADLVRYLAQRRIWSREEFEQTAVELGLMPAGAIEVINDAAFERCDEPILEGEDPLEVNEQALRELLDGH